jgi:hypothetical protein
MLRLALAIVLAGATGLSAVTQSSVTYTAPSGSANNITFTFNRAYEVFQYATGDWGVVGPVTITSMTPAAGGGQHGWMANPSSPVGQAFDNRAGDYNASLMPSLPYVAQPGVSVIKTKSLPTPGHKNVCTQFAAVLTVVSAAPSSPSTTFRPPYTAGGKPIFFTTNLRTELLPSLAPVTGAINQATAERQFKYTRIDFMSSWHAEEVMPFDAVEEGYGADMTADDMKVYFWLCLNSPVAAKMTTLIHVVQSGIDLFGCHTIGTKWERGGGGIGQGRCLTYTFAAALLGSPEMQAELSAAVETDFHETAQLYYGRNAHKVLFGLPNYYGEKFYWNGINGNASGKDYRDPVGWIDGGEIPGDSYQGLTWGGYKYTGLMLNLVPELQNYWPEPNLYIIEYAYRIDEIGAWTMPDPCSKNDPGVYNGTCLAGSGRFPELHGTKHTIADAWCRISIFGEFMFKNYKNYQTGVKDRGPKTAVRKPAPFPLTVSPRPCRNGELVLITADAPVKKAILVDRKGDTIEELPVAAGAIQWVPKNREAGIYYIQAENAAGKQIEKVTIVE